MDAVTVSEGIATNLAQFPLRLVLLAAWLPACSGSQDLAKASLETLMNTEVTTASKKAQKLSQTAAAIYVITQQDIRRSGLTSIPELLRMVPGLSVARQDSNKWAITARGFSGRFANKLLVLMDGRTVYSPVFSGVWWDVQDVILEDVDRIEVIRGPGASLYGANAVNGVINIITKAAQDTQGGLATAGGGTEERGFGSTRFGGKLGAQSFYRVAAKYFNRSSSPGVGGKDGADGWSVLRGRFRVDTTLSDRNSVTLQGDVYRGDAGETTITPQLAPPYTRRFIDNATVAGGNLLMRWKHLYAGGADSALQVYFDRNSREDVLLRQSVDTVDFDWQHHMPLQHRQDLVWGAGLRLDESATRGSLGFSLSPARRVTALFSAFVQDEISVVPDRFRVTLGLKLEHNAYSGLEMQPGVRLLWSPSERHTAWGAVSRAVRTPSRVDSDSVIGLGAFPGAGGVARVLTLFGNPRIGAESVVAYEAGYRVQAAKRVFLDLASFYNAFSGLRSQVPLAPFFEQDPVPHVVLPLLFVNAAGGASFGGEGAMTWDVTDRWQVHAGYSLLRMRLAQNGGPDQESPNHQFQARSDAQLTRHLELGTDVYHVGRLLYQGVPAYTRVDARLGWRVGESLEVSVGLQNLLNARHWEFVSTQGGKLPTQSKRGAYTKLTWQF